MNFPFSLALPAITNITIHALRCNPQPPRHLLATCTTTTVTDEKLQISSTVLRNFEQSSGTKLENNHCHTLASHEKISNTDKHCVSYYMWFEKKNMWFTERFKERREIHILHRHIYVLTKRPLPNDSVCTSTNCTMYPRQSDWFY